MNIPEGFVYGNTWNELCLYGNGKIFTLSLWDGYTVGHDGVFSSDLYEECFSFLKKRYEEIYEINKP